MIALSLIGAFNVSLKYDFWRSFGGHIRGFLVSRVVKIPHEILKISNAFVIKINRCFIIDTDQPGDQIATIGTMGNDVAVIVL